MRGAAILALVAVAGCVEVPESRPQPGTAIVCEIGPIVDGDTFVLTCPGKARVLARLSSVDSPEIAAANCPKERVQGQVARAYLQDLVDRNTVTDVRYGARLPDKQRRLVEVRLGERDLGELMVAGGHAQPISGSERIDWCALP
jgi:endonuclease YncB( thermonuclease family)